MIKKKFKKIIKMDTIYEDYIYVEQNKRKYNEYNQINILDKLFELYVMFLKLFI